MIVIPVNLNVVISANHGLWAEYQDLQHGNESPCGNVQDLIGSAQEKHTPK